MTTQKFRAAEITYVAMFAALMAVGANLTSFISIGSVPLTLQTFFAILAGALLGSRLGSMAMIVYTLVGLIGIPVFAQMVGGMAILTKPSFGFVISFIILAYATGKIIEKNPKPTFSTFLTACFVGLVINFTIGTTYLYFSLKYFLGMENLSYYAAWEMMFFFLCKDIGTTIIAALLCPKVYKIIHKSSYQYSSSSAG